MSNFATYGEFRISEDQEYLIGWRDTDKETDPKKICPENEETIDYYIVTEEFKHNLATSEETLTGKLGCSFIQ
ncbi:MAG: hypothetical protein AAFY41_18585 [Bacteroidota bacterium]